MAVAAEMPVLPDWSLLEALDWISKVVVSERTANFSLLLELQAGSIIATAIDPHTGVRSMLPAEHWIDVDRLEAEERIGQEARNRDLVVSSADIKRIWQTTDDDTTRLPEVMSPVGDGYMPVYYVALWIATKGGAVTHAGACPGFWQDAYKSIVDAASSGSIRVFGKRRGTVKAIAARRFVELAVQYPDVEWNAELWDGDELFLHSAGYVDDFLWKEGVFCDELVRYKKTKWARLTIAKADVRRLWPFAGQEGRPSRPGRPSSEALILSRVRTAI